jgi:predicted dehydrogenase/threonine dehydrogenase-like Zn-dependent dehydrogenase
MKQVAQNYRSGELVVLDVPAPACKPGGVLVRSLYSLISTGTEMMKVSEARLSLLGKARARPDQVRKLADSLAQQGPMGTYRKAIDKLDSYTPLGYSLCGVVTEVGAGVDQFAVGDVVAAAGNEFALHAEVNWVPVNLCVRVPDGVAAEHAAFATVGAIAMQGVRRGEVQLGETACVIGLGLVGQLVVRLLVAAGVGVVGLDPSAERCGMAEKAGAMVCAAPDRDGIERVERVLLETTDGLGADHIFLAAGGATNEPVETAARLARDRARVVDIGKTRLDLPWNDYYEKELDVRFSRSYGPGRYDDRYELEGIDYPAGYVRWTERRNLACFLDLIAGEAIRLDQLVSAVRPIEAAGELYESLRTGELHGVGFLLEYPHVDAPVSADRPLPSHRTVVTSSAADLPSRPATPIAGKVRVGFIGAGNYASSMLLPHLAKHEDVELSVVATARSLSAVNAQRKFGFDSATTDADALLDDPAVDAVFVVTRHHSHAEYVARALESGKSVFVEKPLALTPEQLQRVLDVVERTGNDRLMVGFNRRFAPLFSEMRSRFASQGGPLVARYLVNAGSLGARSWYLDTEKEGSRFLGEGGHFIDALSALVGSAPREVRCDPLAAEADRHVTLTYDGGSTGFVTYVTGGNARFPKETIDLTGGGGNARLDNFVRATVWKRGGRRVKRSLLGQDKGQRAQLDAFVTSLRHGAPMPIDLTSLVRTTRATIAAEQSLSTGEPVTL